MKNKPYLSEKVSYRWHIVLTPLVAALAFSAGLFSAKGLIFSGFLGGFLFALAAVIKYALDESKRQKYHQAFIDKRASLHAKRVLEVLKLLEAQGTTVSRLMMSKVHLLARLFDVQQDEQANAVRAFLDMENPEALTWVKALEGQFDANDIAANTSSLNTEHD